MMRKFDLPQYLEYIYKYAITETHMVNPILLSILRQPAESLKMLDSIRTILVAGAPLDGDTQNKFAAILNPEARCVQVWGMTESGWGTSFHYPEVDDTGSIGRLLPNVEVKYVPQTDYLAVGRLT